MLIRCTSILFVVLALNGRWTQITARKYPPSPLQSADNSDSDNVETSATACPADLRFCPTRVARGECFGSGSDARLTRKYCPCACDLAHYTRLQRCCDTVQQQEMFRFCLPNCRYNTTKEELLSPLGILCVSKLSTWSYCTSEGADNTACCTRAGVAAECLRFCRGDVPTCSLLDIFSYQPCLVHLDAMLQCGKDSLTRLPRWQPDWKQTC